ncbi:MAG: hypothetical protein HY574_14155 [candidate division NC10 bacterium]|nr:hypothetical protein [candidate division NC10 bacterium]
MSGIIGIWNLDGRPVEEGVLTGMSATLAHRGPDGEELWIQGPTGLACRLLRVTPEAATETQPLVHSSGTVLVFDGRLDNREELLASLTASPSISPDSPDPALVLAAYEVFGERFPERLTGDFALGLLDPSRRQLLLARDAIGVRPLYYAHPRNTFLFASEIKALLVHPRVSAGPNDDVLAEFLLDLPRNDQGLTFFEGVSSLPPAHMAILTPGGFVTRRYWDFDPTRRVRLGSFQEYAEAFRHYFEQAVRRRLRSAYPVAVSVSGGLDSSAIFCLTETLRRSEPRRLPPLFGISYTSADWPHRDDKDLLTEIERAYGVTIERVPMSVGLLDGSREMVWHLEAPLLEVTWNGEHLLLDCARERGARVVLTGLWADQMLFGQAYLVDLFRRFAWGQVWAHLKEFRRWFPDAGPRYFWQQFFLELVNFHVPEMLLPLLRKLRLRAMVARDTPDRPWYTEAFRNRVGHCASKQTPISGPFATAHARSLYKEARWHYHVLCMEWTNKKASMHGLEMAFPFLDRDLLSFLMGIPGEMQTRNGVPRAILREAMRRVLPPPIVERRWRADLTDLLSEAIQRDYPELVHCLQPDGKAIRFGYVKGEVMREELARLDERIRDPGSEFTSSLVYLLGLELWLQVFFGETFDFKGGLACAGAN